jgi:integrase
VGTLSRMRPYIIVGLDAGLRPPSEIFGLQVSDVDFERNVLRADTKTDVEREIEMRTDRLRGVLRGLVVRAQGEYLFTNSKGAQMKCVKSGFRKLLGLAGVRRASSYTMRHTCATRLGDAGLNAFQLMAFMGHTGIETSARYVHVGLNAGMGTRLSTPPAPEEAIPKVANA